MNEIRCTKFGFISKTPPVGVVTLKVVTISSLLVDRLRYLPSRVKSGNLGQQVNSDIHLQTLEILMGLLLMSRLIRIFTVCLVNLFNQNMKQTRSSSEFS